MTPLAVGNGAPLDVIEGRARWALVLGDCLAADGLPSLPDGGVAHVISDPPYDERTHSRARSLKDGGSDIQINFDPLANMLHVAEFLRVARRWSLAFCAVEQVGDYKRAAGDEAWTRAGIWHRTDGTPQISADRPAQAAEGIAIMHSTSERRRWNAGGNRGVWMGGVERDDRQHPTQKPLWLMERLIREFTDPGEIICDAFAGSGSTGVACLRLGRRFIGWERDPVHHTAAMKRLDIAREQVQMFLEHRAMTEQLGLGALRDRIAK